MKASICILNFAGIMENYYTLYNPYIFNLIQSLSAPKKLNYTIPNSISHIYLHLRPDTYTIAVLHI